LQSTGALALFLQDTISVGNWTFAPGIRYERLEQTYEDYNKPSQSGKNILNMIAGSLGVTYQFNDSWLGFASFNRGISPPSPKSALSGITEESSYAYEVGARYTNPQQALSIEAVGFYTQFHDLIVIDNIGGTGTGETENFGRVDSAGLEFSAQYDPGVANAWKYRNPWYFTTTYTSAIQQNSSSSTDPTLSGAFIYRGSIFIAAQ
jgi:Fe(3+) dicitrate transport protein